MVVECIRLILWDYTSELYKRIDLKDAVWEEVAHFLGLHFSDRYFMCINICWEKQIEKLFLSIASIRCSVHNVKLCIQINYMHLQ